jgi:hypothetical protein
MAGVTAGDYCIFGSNPDSTTAAGKAFLAYRSALVGLQPGTAGPTVCGKCPSGPTADALSGAGQDGGVTSTGVARNLVRVRATRA